jgi:tetratricopeptide (TPR) repeat protein
MKIGVWPHRTIDKGGKEIVKLLHAAAMVLAWCAIATPGVSAQSQPAPAQNPPAQPANNQNKPAAPSSSNNNPFPEDENTVPVMPDKNTINLPDAGSATGMLALPGFDLDPVHSPDEDEAQPASGSTSSFSSSLSGIGAIDPDADPDTPPPGRHGRHDAEVPQHQETAAEDETVGKYYLAAKDWKAALSRFESALVLDPDNPDVYWGLAESERHLGRFAEARQNYQKVMDYDPGSHHAKDAGKLLKDPEIANAKATPAAQPVTAQPSSTQ